MAELSDERIHAWGETALRILSAEPHPTLQDLDALYYCYHFGIGAEPDKQKAAEFRRAYRAQQKEAAAQREPADAAP